MINDLIYQVNTALDLTAYNRSLIQFINMTNRKVPLCRTAEQRPAESNNQYRSLKFPDYAFGGDEFPINNAPRIKRNRSALEFQSCAHPLSSDTFKKVIAECFFEGEISGQPIRPYASGGALYSVIPIIHVRNVEGFDPAVYAVRPKKYAIELISSPSQDEINREVFIGKSRGLESYDFFILYCLIAASPISKYADRGLKLAIIEAGGASHLVESKSQEFGLSGCIWGGFYEEPLAIVFNIDCRALWPIIGQFVGRLKL